MEKKIINLNLIMTYPVDWSRYKVFRDFIQNFYDSVPIEEFHSRFTFEYKDDVLTLRCKDVSYNYEWLLHIGASSKTNSDKNSAGYFGEGFKIAALCSIRDFNYEIETSSSDWCINVIENEITIDGKETKTLAYELEKNDFYSPDTVLILKNVKSEDMEKFYSALYSFYYRENPLIGEEIYSDENYAVYHRSDIPKVKGFPSTYDNYGEGIVFAGFQARGSLKEPLIFCQNNYEESDRDRGFFSRLDNIDVLVACIMNLPPEQAVKLLIIYKDKWYIYPKGSLGHSSYYTVIKNLIFRFVYSSNLREEFKEQFPNILYATKLAQSNKKALNIRKYCLCWIKNNPEYKLVQDCFRYLGIQSIEEKCESLRVLPEVNSPTQIQGKYITQLERCVKDIFVGFLEVNNLPECRVITNLNASVSGYASCLKRKDKRKNIYGYKYVTDLQYICIKDIHLNKESFESALTVYVHELCHTFGGDKSENFSYAMTMAMEILLCSQEEVNIHKQEWLNIGEEKE